MKFQHVSIFFIIIFIPILLVISYYISLQVNTIKLEASYNEKLLNATYDAMTAFELNTANEDLSSVSDALRSIIDASNNIFFNTLCTNFGISNASKSFVQPYIPAILYTLYDGYYIYSPTNITEICVDKYGRTIRTSDFGVSCIDVIGKYGIYTFDNSAIQYDVNNPIEPVGGSKIVSILDLESKGIKQEYGQILYKNNNGTYSTQIHTFNGDRENSTYYKRDYILKSYIPYSARYFRAKDSTKPEINVTITYTLDNFMNIEGNIGEIYYTKSGYFIKNDLINKIVIKENSGNIYEVNSWKDYSEETLDKYIEDPEHYEVIIKLSDYIEISNKLGVTNINSTSGSGTEIKYWNDAQSAVKYYIHSYIFSGWIYENLGDIEAKDIQNVEYSFSDSINTKEITEKTDLLKDILYNFSNDESKPFFIDNNNDPENGESFFYKHKRNVIKNSITYNLLLSMIVYTEESRTVEFNMPVLKETEWDRILNNVSIVTFMEGMKCGLKYYNNYAIVTSTNNEISIDDNEIYYVPRVKNSYNELNSIDDKSKVQNNTIETAHRIDCEDLYFGNANNFDDGDITNKEKWLGCISFKSKEIKYDKILNKDGTYTYDHMAYTDYNCIVDSNYKVKNVDNTEEDGNTDVLEYLIKNINSTEANINEDLKRELEYKLLAYRIAIAKERNNLYKTTSFTENYGWQVITPSSYKNNTITINNLNNELTKTELNEIKKIEITLKNFENVNNNIYTDNISVKFNNKTIDYSSSKTISAKSKSRLTLEYKQDFNNSDNIINITIKSDNNTKFELDAIKFYYK